MNQLTNGTIVTIPQIQSVQGENLILPSLNGFTHLQFRRYAGCPICNLHILSFARRHHEIKEAGIHEFVIFYSSADELKESASQLPFPLIADPGRKLYNMFGVGISMFAVLNPLAWPSAMRGLFLKMPGMPGKGQSLSGVPGDFLIDSAGKIIASKYGKHADDHWSVDDVLALSGKLRDLPIAQK